MLRCLREKKHAAWCAVKVLDFALADHSSNCERCASPRALPTTMRAAAVCGCSFRAHLRVFAQFCASFACLSCQLRVTNCYKGTAPTRSAPPSPSPIASNWLLCRPIASSCFRQACRSGWAQGGPAHLHGEGGGPQAPPEGTYIRRVIQQNHELRVFDKFDLMRESIAPCNHTQSKAETVEVRVFAATAWPEAPRGEVGGSPVSPAKVS